RDRKGSRSVHRIVRAHQVTRGAVVRALAFAIVLAGFSAATAGDEKFTSKEGQFAIQFPPNLQAQTKKQADGQRVEMQQLSATSEGKTWAVMFLDLPEGAGLVPPKTILDGAQGGALKATGANLVEAKDIAFGEKKYPGRDVIVEVKTETLRSRIVLV